MDPIETTGNTAELDQQQGVTQQPALNGENQGDSQTAEEREAQEAAAREAAKPKVDNVQRRIDEITRKRHDEVNRERARADALERELATLKRGNAGEQGQQGDQGQQQREPLTQAEIDRRIEARAEQVVSKREFDARCGALVDNGTKEFGADFDKAIKTLGSLQAIVDEKGEFTDFARAIVDTEVPHKLMKHLGDNPDEAARILLLSPLQQAREIGRLEVRLSTQPAAEPNVSKAPPPPSHVGSRNTATSSAPSAKDDVATWMRKRNAQVNGS